MLHHLIWFLLGLHQYLFSIAKYSIYKNLQSPWEIPNLKNDIILMLNSEQYIPAGLLRIWVHIFGVFSVVHVIHVNPFFRTNTQHAEKNFHCSFCLTFLLLPTLCSAKWPNPPTSSPANERGTFWTIEEFLCIQKAEFPLEPKIRQASFTSFLF